MSRRAVSIGDIARIAGVSHSTVSRALHDNPLISLDVRAHIQRLAREMGYTPNAIAQSLQQRRTDTVGLVVTSIADPFYADVVKGIEEEARRASLSVFLSASHNDPAQEMNVIEIFHRRRVDGIIIASSRIGNRQTERLARVRVPIVLINDDAQRDEMQSATVDDYAGARLALEHLLGLGHRAIGYIGAGSRARSNNRRMAGYESALAEAGITPPAEWVAVAPPDDELPEQDMASGRTLLLRLLDAGVTAVFCYNDMIAVGVLTACREQGIAVPRDLSVVGFDDIELAKYMTPPLTTIHQPKVRLGRAAMRMLLDLLDDRAVEDHVLVPTLVERGSTASCQPSAISR
jgi:LacI family transcriptional regulator/LacI family repressor for deo operon, udp, cdd, tsx, nupC, and nupG